VSFVKVIMIETNQPTQSPRNPRNPKNPELPYGQFMDPTILIRMRGLVAFKS
jgi:hypothetical protein